MTTITDRFFLPNGSPLPGGTIFISVPTAFTSGGNLVAVVTPPANIEVKIARDGTFTVPLYPTDVATPSGVYYVVSYSFGGPIEIWTVPTSGSPVGLSAVRTSPVPIPGGVVALSAIMGAASLQSSWIASNGAAWVAQNKQLGDMRDDPLWVADSGVTDNWPVLARLVAAGFKDIWWPKNTSGIAPGNTIPADLTIWGEDWKTSSILSASDPATSALYIGAHTQIYNMNLRGNASSPISCPTGCVVNAGQTRTFVATPYSAMQANGDSAYDHAPIQVRQYGSGDAIYTEVEPGSNGVGVRSYTLDTTGIAVLAGRLASGAGLAVQDLAVAAATGSMASWFTTFKTGGEMIGLVQRTSTYTGPALLMDMADAGGTFTGQFLDLRNATVQKFIINSQGVVFFGDSASISVRTGAGSPEGAIAAPVGSMYLRSNGGAGTTLYVKESGTGGNGWAAK